MGLHHLSRCQWAMAARSFASASSDVFAVRPLMSPADLALYGCLSALAAGDPGLFSGAAVALDQLPVARDLLLGVSGGVFREESSTSSGGGGGSSGGTGVGGRGTSAGSRRGGGGRATGASVGGRKFPRVTHAFAQQLASVRQSRAVAVDPFLRPVAG